MSALARCCCTVLSTEELLRARQRANFPSAAMVARLTCQGCRQTAAAGVGVMHESALDRPRGAVAPPESHPQRAGHERCLFGGCRMPADDRPRPRVAVDCERDIRKPIPRSDIGE